MRFKEKMLLRFKRNQCVGYTLYWKDHRITEHITILNGDHIQHKNRRFSINKDKSFIKRGIPWFIYYTNDPEPLPVKAVDTFDTKNPIDPTEWKPSDIDSIDYQVAIDSKVAHDILSSQNENDILKTLLFASLFIMMIGFSILGYFIYNLTELIQAGGI